MRAALAAFALSAILQSTIRVRDTQGVERLPLKVGQGKVEALFFVAHDCPISNYYSSEIRRMCEDYASRGLGCSLVYVEPNLSDADAEKHAREYGHGGYPRIVDRSHALVAAAGATVTPEAVIVKADETIAYRGRVDNLYVAPGKPRRAATEHDLRDALNAVLAGKSAPKPETQPVGCYIPDLSAYSH
jgi:hypothetical protein